MVAIYAALSIVRSSEAEKLRRTGFVLENENQAVRQINGGFDFLPGLGESLTYSW